MGNDSYLVRKWISQNNLLSKQNFLISRTVKKLISFFFLFFYYIKKNKKLGKIIKQQHLKLDHNPIFFSIFVNLFAFILNFWIFWKKREKITNIFAQYLLYDQGNKNEKQKKLFISIFEYFIDIIEKWKVWPQRLVFNSKSIKFTLK